VERAWRIKGREDALLPQKAIARAIAIKIPPYNLARGVDATGAGEGRAWGIKGCEGALLPQKTMAVAVIII
jgi:hypothetical protein